MKKYLFILLLISCSSNQKHEDLSKTLYEMKEKLEAQELENQRLLNRIETFEHVQNNKIDRIENSNSVNFNAIKTLMDKQVEQEKFNLEFLSILQIHEDKITKIGTNIPKLSDDKSYREKLRLGIKLYNNDNFEEALKIFRSLEKTQKHPSESLYKVLTYNLALTEYKLKDFKQAKQRFNEILKDSHSQKKYERYIPSVIYHLGMIYKNDGDCFKSNSLFNRLKQDFPNHYLTSRINVESCLKA